MPNSDPNWIDYGTLVAALVAASSPFVKLWEIRRSDRERINLHIEWVDFGPNHPIGEAPFLYVHNKSDTSILITEVRFNSGFLLKKRLAYTALDYDDPMDLNFPYEVKPFEKIRLRLAVHMARTYFDRAGFSRKVSAITKRSWLWLEVLTAGRTRELIGAEDVLPWSERPNWRKIEDKE